MLRASQDLKAVQIQDMMHLKRKTFEAVPWRLLKESENPTRLTEDITPTDTEEMK